MTVSFARGLARVMDAAATARVRSTLTDGMPAGYAIRIFGDALVLMEDGAVLERRYTPRPAERPWSAAALHRRAHEAAAWTERGE